MTPNGIWIVIVGWIGFVAERLRRLRNRIVWKDVSRWGENRIVYMYRVDSTGSWEIEVFPIIVVFVDRFDDWFVAVPPPI